MLRRLWFSTFVRSTFMIFDVFSFDVYGVRRSFVRHSFIFLTFDVRSFDVRSFYIHSFHVCSLYQKFVLRCIHRLLLGKCLTKHCLNGENSPTLPIYLVTLTIEAMMGGNDVDWRFNVWHGNRVTRWVYEKIAQNVTQLILGKVNISPFPSIK
jgi:hypothetical protein